MPEVPNTERRWVPDGGLQRHRDKIHKESKIADTKDLPFTFSKPKKQLNAYFECEECGRQFVAGKNTVMLICPTCNKLTKAKKI